MKSRDTLLRLKRFHLDEKRRRVAQIELMIAEFDRMSADLDRDILAEEQKAKISDPITSPIPLMPGRRCSAGTISNGPPASSKASSTTPARDVEEAFDEFKKIELLDGRERAAEIAAESQREQAEYDRIGLSQHLTRATA